MITHIDTTTGGVSTPIRNFSKLISKNDVHVKYLPRTISYYLKYLLTLPFNALENSFYSKKINEHKIEQDPVFILGYWRSGTTYLQNLFSQNNDYGYLNFYQSFFPDGMLISEPILSPIMDFIAKTLKIQQPAHRIQLQMDFPSEEDIALVSMVSPSALSFGHLFPSQAMRFFKQFTKLKDRADEENFMRDYYHLVKKLSYVNKGKQLVLKTPANLGRIPTLLKIFPNAKFIHISRNPYEVFYSNKKLWDSFKGQSLEDFTTPQVEKIIFESYIDINQRYTETKNLIPQKNLVELKYEDLVKNPLEKLQSIFNELNLNSTPLYWNKIQRFIEKNHRKNCLSHNYSDSDLKKINSYWGHLIKESGYDILEVQEL